MHNSKLAYAKINCPAIWVEGSRALQESRGFSFFRFRLACFVIDVKAVEISQCERLPRPIRKNGGRALLCGMVTRIAHDLT
jgi:hypothetical protein